MKRMLLAFALASASPAVADVINPLESADLMKKAINEPGTAWTFYGGTQQSKVMKDKDVPGGQFVRVTVSQKGANPWDAGAGYPIIKPINTGDVIFFAVFMRAPNLKDGETASMPMMGVGEADSPYQPIAQTDFKIDNQWRAYYFSAKAPRGYPRGTARIGAQVAADKQVIDLGPAFAIDLGANYDMSTLPTQ